MENSVAYQIGQVFGVLLVIFFVLAVLGGGIACLVMSIRTKKVGWIIGTVVLSLPILAVCGLIFFSIAAGVMKGLANRPNSPEASAEKTTSKSDLLTAPLTAITGTNLPYTISLPAKGSWKEQKETSDADFFWANGSYYVMVIPEPFGVGSSEGIAKISMDNLLAVAPEAVKKETVPVTIDGREWLQFDVEARVSGLKLVYRYYVYSDDDITVQIITFTSPSLFAKGTPIFDRIAKSFKFPPTPSLPAAEPEKPPGSGQPINPGE